MTDRPLTSEVKLDPEYSLSSPLGPVCPNEDYLNSSKSRWSSVQLNINGYPFNIAIGITSKSHRANMEKGGTGTHAVVAAKISTLLDFVARARASAKIAVNPAVIPSLYDIAVTVYKTAMEPTGSKDDITVPKRSKPIVTAWSE